MIPQARAKFKMKCVRWSTVTVYEFGVGIGGSAVPKRGGPAIGLARRPKHVWSTTVDAAGVNGIDDEELANSSLSGSSSSDEDSPMGQQPKSVSTRTRTRRVRWLKPLERVSMLEKAGYSERKIYRMLMESSHIAMSRRLSLRLPSPFRH